MLSCRHGTELAVVANARDKVTATMEDVTNHWCGGTEDEILEQAIGKPITKRQEAYRFFPIVRYCAGTVTNRHRLSVHRMPILAECYT
jgi:hypothetical protein